MTSRTRMKLSFPKPSPMWPFLRLASFHLLLLLLLLLLQRDEDQEEGGGGHDCFIDPVYYKTIKDLAAAAAAAASALMAQGRWVGFARGEEEGFELNSALLPFPPPSIFVCPFLGLLILRLLDVTPVRRCRSGFPPPPLPPPSFHHPRQKTPQGYEVGEGGGVLRSLYSLTTFPLLLPLLNSTASPDRSCDPCLRTRHTPTTQCDNNNYKGQCGGYPTGRWPSFLLCVFISL